MKLKWAEAERKAEYLVRYLAVENRSPGVKKHELAAILMAVAREEYEAVVPRPLP